MTQADRTSRDPITREAAGARRVTGQRVNNLTAATRRLAATIEATERLAEGHAEVLRSADAALGAQTRSRAGSPAVVSLAEAAVRTGRHPEVLRRWCTEGRIPAVRIGRTWAISNETVALLVRHRSRSRPRLDGSRSS